MDWTMEPDAQPCCFSSSVLSQSQPPPLLGPHEQNWMLLMLIHCFDLGPGLISDLLTAVLLIYYNCCSASET